MQLLRRAGVTVAVCHRLGGRALAALSIPSQRGDLPAASVATASLNVAKRSGPDGHPRGVPAGGHRCFSLHPTFTGLFYSRGNLKSQLEPRPSVCAGRWAAAPSLPAQLPTALDCLHTEAKPGIRSKTLKGRFPGCTCSGSPSPASAAPRSTWAPRASALCPFFSSSMQTLPQPSSSR